MHCLCTLPPASLPPSVTPHTCVLPGLVGFLHPSVRPLARPTYYLRLSFSVASTLYPLRLNLLQRLPPPPPPPPPLVSPTQALVSVKPGATTTLQKKHGAASI